MNEPAAVETVDQSAEPQSDLWTADSERAAIQTSDDPTPSAPIDIDEPEPAAVTATPDEPVTSEQPERDANGQFKPKRGKGNPRTDPQARVQQATAREAAAKEEARLAREEAARYRSELEAARRPAATPAAAPQAQTASFPTFEAWAGQNPTGQYEDYLDARSEWRIDRRLAAERQAQTAAQQDQLERSRWEGHKTRLQAAVEADPTLPTLIQTGTEQLGRELHARGILDAKGLPTFPPALLTAVLESDKSVEVYRYLLSHPADAAQLAAEVSNLPVTAASVVRRLLDAHVSTAAVARPDSAPIVHPSAARPPVNRVGGTASATPATPDDLEFGPEFIRLENAREKKAREAGRW